MSPRTGRPKIENPKNVDVKVRLDEETNKRLCEYCAKHGKLRSEVIRQAIISILDKQK